MDEPVVIALDGSVPVEPGSYYVSAPGFSGFIFLSGQSGELRVYGSSYCRALKRMPKDARWSRRIVIQESPNA